jgi:hypothetical protein
MEKRHPYVTMDQCHIVPAIVAAAVIHGFANKTGDRFDWMMTVSGGSQNPLSIWFA